MANYTNHLRASDHPNWRGADGTYNAKHSWARRNLRRTGVCSLCRQKAKTDMCNFNHEYERVAEDWFEACRPCHTEYDIAAALRDPAEIVAKRPEITHCKAGHEYATTRHAVNPSNGKRACWVCRTARRKGIPPESVESWYAEWRAQSSVCAGCGGCLDERTRGCGACKSRHAARRRKVAA